MMTKHWMHEDEWSQATFVRGAVDPRQSAPQPRGDAPNKQVPPDLARDLLKTSTAAFEQGFLPETGMDFLRCYATGSLLVNPRAAAYNFLAHNCHHQGRAGDRRMPVAYAGTSEAVNVVRVRALPRSGDPSADCSAAAGRALAAG